MSPAHAILTPQPKIGGCPQSVGARFHSWALDNPVSSIFSAVVATSVPACWSASSSELRLELGVKMPNLLYAGSSGYLRLYRPQFVGHRIEPYAALATG